MRLRYLYVLFLLMMTIAAPAQPLIMDRSFGSKGEIKISNGRYNEVKDIKATHDLGFYVLIESSRIDSIRDTDILLLKFDAKGKPDLNFATQGKLQTDFMGMDISRGAEISLLADGKLMIAGDGSRKSVPNINMSCLMRCLSNGSPDTTFGYGGTTSIAFDKVSYLSAIAPLNDSSFVIAGNCLRPFDGHVDVFPAIGKIKADGNPEATFVQTGKAWIDFYNGVFSLARVKHTAGGEIKDVLVQEDGKILICGGYLFHYTYEGFIARLLPDGSLDKSFNRMGFVNYDFTPGKFNEIVKLVLYDKTTLLFGASSKTDFDADFCFGKVNLNNGEMTNWKIDVRGQHDVLEDLSVDKGRITLSGRSVMPWNVGRNHTSDYGAVVTIADINHPENYKTELVSFSEKNQNGINRHLAIGKKLIAAGFSLTPNVSIKDVVIAAFKY